MKVKKVLKQFFNLEFIEFENYDPEWLQVFDAPLERFSLIFSTLLPSSSL